MELRRAILLFAIILGLAAIVTSVQAPNQEPQRTDREPSPSGPSTPSATAQRSAASPSATAEITFPADLQPETQEVELAQAVALLITADDPGEVTIPRLGLLDYAEAGSPARFELLPSEPGEYAVFFTPTTDGERRTIGILDVEERGDGEGPTATGSGRRP